MPNERAQSIPLSDQQKRLFPEIYGGLSEKKPELASELNQAEMTKLASLVKKENIEQKKQQEIADINERQQNTIWEQTTTDKNGNVSPLPTIENLQILTNKLGYDIRYNGMNNKIEFLRDGKQIADEFDDIYPLMLSHAVTYDLPREGMQAYIPAVAKKREYHPVQDIISGHTWDRKPRTQRVIDCFNFAEKQHAGIVMRKFFIGAVACLYQESFFTKLVPIIQGKQSLKKTAALGRIFNITPGAWLEGHALKESSKDSVMEAVSCWCCELGEIETTTSGEQGWLKAFLPKASDTYRPPYGRGAITRRRRTVLVGTVNKHDFLKDETGSTRFAVLSSPKTIDIDELNNILGWKYDNDRVIRENEDELIQFWCEIKHYFDQGESWMLSDNEMVKSLAVNDKYQDKGDYHDVIRDYIAEVETAKGVRTAWMTGKQLCEHLRIPTRIVRRVGRSFKELLNHEKRAGGTVFYEIKVYVSTFEER